MAKKLNRRNNGESNNKKKTKKPLPAGTPHQLTEEQETSKEIIETIDKESEQRDKEVSKVFKEQKRRVGRPSRLDENLTEDIEILARLGLSYTAIAEATGVSYSLFHRWLEKYDEFRKRVEVARSKGKTQLLNLIFLHGKKSWQAIAWLLERMYREEFALENRHKVEMTDSRSIAEDNRNKVDFEEFTEEELETMKSIGLKLKQKNDRTEDEIEAENATKH